MYYSIDTLTILAPIHLTLQEAVVVKSLECNLSFSEYKLLAEWLDAYNYVLPANRGLDPNYIALLSGDTPLINTLEVYKLWMKCNIIETTLTVAQQIKVNQWNRIQIKYK